MSTEFYWIAVVVTTILSAARFTRLAVIDKLPPVKELRDRYEERWEGTGWEWLTMCGYCFSLYPTLIIMSLGLMAEVYDSTPEGYDDIGFAAWWIVNGLFAMTYLAAMTVARDGDDD